jgi:hypothetical protein
MVKAVQAGKKPIKKGGLENGKRKHKVPISSLDTKQIALSVKLAMDRRNEGHCLLTSLEEAWREAAGPQIALNRTIPGADLPQSDSRRRLLLSIGKKKRKIEEFQQKVFLNFQELTENKNNNQIQKGEEILKALKTPAKKLDTMVVSALIEDFFKNEDKLNKVFLLGFKKLERKIDSLLNEAKKLYNFKCSDKEINALLKNEIRVLINFLENTKKLLKK